MYANIFSPVKTMDTISQISDWVRVPFLEASQQTSLDITLRFLLPVL